MFLAIRKGDFWMKYSKKIGVPAFVSEEYEEKMNKYCLLIPVINEGERIKNELLRAKNAGIMKIIDVIICDGNSTDGSVDSALLRSLHVNTLLVKKDEGKQGAQFRMGIWWAMKRGYKGIVTIDGNNKDSIEDVPKFISKLEDGYDYIQGSRFIKGGKAINTPISRLLAVKLIHAPVISITAKHPFTDTTNAYRAYSMKYLEHIKVCPLREVFVSYELLAFLSVRATQLGMKAIEIPVCRTYPKGEKMPTKISPIKGNWKLFTILFSNLFGKYAP